MKQSVFVFLLFTVFFGVRSAQATDPSMLCMAWIQPRIVCAANHTIDLPEWRVYYWNTSDVADYDRGLMVYLTIPEDHFVRVEMRTLSEKKGGVFMFARWKDGRLEQVAQIPEEKERP